MSDIVDMLRLRACSLDEQPEHDHGHSDCYLEREAADEIERLRSDVDRWRKTVDAVRNSYDEHVFIPYTLKKAIAKRDITFENLTAEQWFEIYKWFYNARYGEFPEFRSVPQESETDDLRRDLPA